MKKSIQIKRDNDVSVKKHFVVYFEILLMISIVISISYIINDIDKKSTAPTQLIYEEKGGLLLRALSLFNKIIFGDENFVSALDNLDMNQGVYTCPVGINGEICQEYISNECSSKCSVSCLPTSASSSAICKPGTCYDSREGTCQVGATKQKCEQDGGNWYDDPFGNLEVCKPGCCILGDQSLFGTEQQCTKTSSSLGIKKDFRPDVNTELSCILLSKSQKEGACVIESIDGESNSCKFTTESNCLQNIRGKFYTGLLCSHPDLNTDCEPQKTISCVQDKNEIYWLDSCGNRENIYDANKIKSYNDGKILSKSDSCSLVSGSNYLANQKTCGNCNYLLGSICGKASENEKLSDSNAGVVCTDLSCTDENGKERKNGESWCAYQGSFGAEKDSDGLLRSTDTVGSRNFRKVCVDGKINTEPCADFRNEICTEAQTKINSGGNFSTAACRINRGYTCFENNKDGKISKCEENPDCFVKKINVGPNFNFDVCLPKYAPGFDIEKSTGSAYSCSAGNQKCDAYFVKEIVGFKPRPQGPVPIVEWRCKQNCECVDYVPGADPSSAKPSAKFSQQLNDMCISLGDCGTKANYLGTVTTNHLILKDGANGGYKLSNNYISTLTKYADEKLVKGKYIPAADIEKFFQGLGIPGTFGNESNPENDYQEILELTQTTGGMAGIGLLAGAYALGALGPGSTAGLSTVQVIQGGGHLISGAVGPAAAGAFGALAGAAVGIAMVAYLIDATGIAGGMPAWLTYSLMAAGAVAGAIIGYTLLTTAGGLMAGLAAVPIVGWIILVVVIVIIVVLTLLGVGDTKTVSFSFKCNPWQPPTGGKDCGQCGKDGFVCSKYSCQSLGQSCQLVNEGSELSECVYVNANDVNPPVITPNAAALVDGYSIENKENGVKLKSSTGDGCISNVYENILFGVTLDEPAQCSISTEHKDSYEDMDQTLSSGFFIRNHSLYLPIPSLSELGIDNFDLEAQADLNLYVRCKDKNGNENPTDYTINYCIKPGNDTTPPAIVARDPSISKIKFDAKIINASVITNEPSECRWDSKDTIYSNMVNNFTCFNRFSDREYNLLYSGWKCSSTFPVNSNESIFYVRCLDQPTFVGENASKRNANTQSYQLKFTKVSKPLTIDYVNIEGQNFSFATKIGSVPVKLRTSGGYDGTARCGYKWGNQTIDFYETLKNEHSQVFQALLSGDNKLDIVCKDIIGNIIEKTVRFKITIDNEPAQVSRAYASGDFLTVITNEKSNCYYSLDSALKCSFDMSNSTQMLGTDSFTHSTSFDKGVNYYVKCEDTLGNYPSDCSITIRAGQYTTQTL